ncbi:GvpL/GvpF family gas vesicle protein [Streptomyces sp. NPDC089919]|uniref:GvpL/GvpF family gas vesicle protein n=1 Tax=Streptomyces sp. NPDC089919 TaxID=3155188 RepID=UPI00341A8097
MSEPELLYVYAVVAAADAAVPQLPELAGVEGVDGGADGPAPGPRAVGDGVLAAVVDPVEHAYFEEAALHLRLEDLSWLAGLARAHHRVVTALGGARTTVPLQLATVCRGEDGVRRLLREGRERLLAALARLEGTEEWGVKLYADPAGPEVPEVPVPAAGGAPATGRDHLRRRLGDRRRHEERTASAATTAEAVHRRLTALAAEAVLHPPQRAGLVKPEPSGTPEEAGPPEVNVLNAAYLVPRDDRPDFLERLPGPEELPAGMRAALTGPRVPYSFTHISDGTRDAEGREGGPR